MENKEQKMGFFVKCEVCLLTAWAKKDAFGVLYFLTPSLSGGKPPSIEGLHEKLAWATSPPLSQGVAVGLLDPNLVACDEVEHNIAHKRKSRGAETLVDCGVGKLTTDYLTKLR